MDLEIIKIAADTKNNKELKNFTHKSKYKNSLCGDEMEIRIIVKNQKIFDIGFQSKSFIFFSDLLIDNFVNRLADASQ